MKRQTEHDRADERRGMEKGKYHQTAHDRADERRGMEHASYSKSSRVSYKNETEEPTQPMEGHMNPMDMGCHEFKGEADPIAYGQASEKGCASDQKKIKAQFKNYGWD